MWGCGALRTSGFWEVFPRIGSRPWRLCIWWLWWASCWWLTGLKRGIWGSIPSSCQNHLFWGSSLFLLCSTLAANSSFSLVKLKQASGWADDLQDCLSLAVCTRQPSLLSTKHYWGLLPIGSVDCLPLSTVCEWKVLFGHFCQLVLLCTWTLRTLCGNVCSRLRYWLFPQQVCDSSVFQCVNAYSIYAIGIFVVFCKMGNSRSIH